MAIFCWLVLLVFFLNILNNIFHLISMCICVKRMTGIEVNVLSIEPQAITKITQKRQIAVFSESNSYDGAFITLWTFHTYHLLAYTCCNANIWFS